jgi:hypothetical protein
MLCMYKSSMRGMLLSLILIFSLSIFVSPLYSYAEGEISVKSTSFEKSTIIEFTNEGNREINSFRIWLSSEFNFESFKTESGWTGEKTPQGVIIFTTKNPVSSGESVKFGVKTNESKPGINWKAIDKNEKQIELGKSLPDDLSKQTSPASTTTNVGVTENSSFRIIPDKPNAGSSIRATGDNFGPSQQFEFFIDTKKLGMFETDSNGHFITTFEIPEDQKTERVDFIIKDQKGEEKKISLRIGINGTQLPSGDIVKLTVKGIPEVMHRGDFLEIFGTAQPGSAISASVKGPNGEVINTRTAEVDAKGTWKLAEPIIVPLDTPFGRYSAEITDGRETISTTWAVETSKVILIAPSNLKFEPGETLKFNGTALPDQSIELVLEDPLGEQKISDIFEVDSSGVVSFQYRTTANVDREGTWTLIATQGKYKEFIYVGLGELPSIPVNMEFNKLNYKSSEKAIISMTGKASQVLSLLIIDPSDKAKGPEIPITLGPDGRGTYNLDLKGYSSGVYTAILSKGSAKSTEIFTVGLQTGSGAIEISTTKLNYEPGESVLVLGNAKPNTLLKLTMTDGKGNIVKEIDAFADKNGKITEDSFRIPSGAKQALWKITATSGSNFATTEIEIVTVKKEGLLVSVEKSPPIQGVGQALIIKVLGGQQTVNIEIISDEGKVIEELSFPASKDGKIIQPWIVPPDTEPGTYTFKAKDAYNSAETTFEIK